MLCILDGWGVSESKETKYNAINSANTPNWNSFLQSYPNSVLQCSGESVGLPASQMGNSEVGHTIIGSGRIVYQDLLRINKDIRSNALKDNEILIKLKKLHQNSKKKVHLLGLCSDGGVHSHIEHLIYLINLLINSNIEVRLHLFLDGRDVLPRSAEKYLNQIQEITSSSSLVKIATLAGRFYAMDRDNRNERTDLSIKAIAHADCNKFSNWQEYLTSNLSQGLTDEFMLPQAADDYEGIEEGDSFCIFNFRSDRVRQLANSMLALPINYCMKIGMTHYSKELDQKLSTIFLEQFVRNGLSELLSNRQYKQLKIAETEKYAHVTFFFNGGIEEPFIGEDRILVPSPKVKTYDLQPQMSAFKLTDQLIEALGQDKYHFIVVNYANADMIGHTGNFAAAVKAVETIDDCLGRLSSEILKLGGTLIITADHGNIEHMYDEQNTMAHTAHTLNPVPFVIVSNEYSKEKIKLLNGNLADIAPTLLKIMDISIPKEMTGKPIF